MIKSFYVYIYYDQNNVPFYVGKGKDSRYSLSSHLHGPNKFLINKILKVGQENVKIWKSGPLLEEDAFYAEAYYIIIFGRKNDKDFSGGTLCNLSDGGEGSNHTEETKQKMSKNSPWKGQKRSEETKQKMKKSHKGKILSEEHRKKISINNGRGFLGKTLSKEHREKISNTLTGYVHSEETCRKISEAGKGRKHTKETKIKMSFSSKNKIKFNIEQQNEIIKLHRNNTATSVIAKKFNTSWGVIGRLIMSLKNDQKY